LQATTTRGTQRAMEPAVLPSEIEQLPDLAGYLKLASRAAWLATTLPITEVRSWPVFADSGCRRRSSA
jgi:hypothetical protein